MAKIVFPDWKSCCIRRKFGVKKHHANFQVAAHGMRDCFSCEFHSRPRGRHSGSSRRPHGGRSKNGGNGLAFKPAGAGGDFTGRTGGNNSGDYSNNTRARRCTGAKYSRSNARTTGCAGTTKYAGGCDDTRARHSDASGKYACDTGANRNPTGGHTNNIRVKRCPRNCSRAAS
jgi:hypothetical protein